MVNPVVEFITIGREILDGRVIDTNSVVLAEFLKPLGLVPRHAQRVDDQMDRILEAFRLAESRSSLIFVTGGLGPTSDDLTSEAFAKYLNEDLVENKDALSQIENWFKKVNRQMTDVQKKQALFARGTSLLKNSVGTAPGFTYTDKKHTWFFMPGVPLEMKKMMEDEIIPRLPRNELARSATWSTHFTSEGKLQELLNPVEKSLPAHFEITYRTRFPENHIALYAPNATQLDQTVFEATCDKIDSALRDQPIFFRSRSLETKLLEEVVLEQLKNKKILLSTVESCTGGLIAERLTDISGSSQVFWGGLVTYDNASKLEIALVKPETLEKYGAVSAQTAVELALGGLLRQESSLQKFRTSVKEKPHTHICISTTGIAGPNGGTPEKPVGLCFIALACSAPRTTTFIEVRGLPHLDRKRLRQFFSQKALELVRTFIHEELGNNPE